MPSSLFHRIRSDAAHFVAKSVKQLNPLFTKVREGTSTALRKAANTARDVNKALDSDVAKSIAAATGTEALREGAHAGVGYIGSAASTARSDLERVVPKHLTVPTSRIVTFM
jgi:hypothetical protein